MLRRHTTLILVSAIFLFAGIGCKGENPAALDLAKPITLKYWRPFDGSDAFDEIINKYRALHPHITVEYRRLRPETYEQELVNALAEDRGPDIFAVPSGALRGYRQKLAAMPAKYRIANIIDKGGLQGAVEIKIEDKRGLTPRQLQQNFLDVVVRDVVLPQDNSSRIGNVATDSVFGVPLAVDTLMLLYNKDLLNTSGIANPPATWTDFQEMVKKVTVLDENAKIVRPGAVMGASNNVPRPGDILALLMMQAGAQMHDEFGTITWQETPQGSQRSPGLDALRFYEEFALPSREVYTWNELQPNGLEAFIQGRAAFMFGYAYQLPLIKARAPKLNFAVAGVPQQTPLRPINIANYWVESVSRKSKNTDAAWDFVLFATNAQNVSSYLKATKKPTALRALVPVQQDDVEIGPFADQLLTSRSWYRGKDSSAADSIMEEMISDTLAATKANDREKFNKAIENAVSKLQQTL